MYMDNVVLAGILVIAGTILVAVGVAVAIWMDQGNKPKDGGAKH